MNATIRFSHGMTFVATGETGHAVLMDTAKTSGGHDAAPTPKEMLLFALGGCTGMDVVGILRKMRITPRSFEVKVRGELQAEVPRAFTTFHLDYHFEGDDLSLDSLERAVVLSQDKYCSVSMTLRPPHPIGWSITLNGETVRSSEQGAAS